MKDPKDPGTIEKPGLREAPQKYKWSGEAEYQRNYRGRMRALGFQKIEIWVPAAQAQSFRELAERMRNNALRETGKAGK